MKTHLQKWGNSLALRIPKAFAEKAGLHADAAVELSPLDGALIVQPIVPPAPPLVELLRAVKDDDLPGEWQTGPPVGREVW